MATLVEQPTAVADTIPVTATENTNLHVKLPSCTIDFQISVKTVQLGILNFFQLLEPIFRLFLYHQNPVMSCYALRHTLSAAANANCIQHVTLSNVLVFRIPENNMSQFTEDENVYLAFMELSPDHTMILIDFYICTFAHIRAWVFALLQNYVLLDLDKSLILSDADTREEQRHAFTGDIEIAGNMAVSSGYFRHRIMIRPGCSQFLLGLIQSGKTIIVVTAGDLHYGRMIVCQANSRNWVSGPTSPDDPVVKINSWNVFSVRNAPNDVSMKKISNYVPYLSPHFQQHVLHPERCIVVDDNLLAWACY